MKIFLNLCFSFFVYFLVVAPALAISDPLSRPNNRFGIHLADISDLSDAGKLVNSNGGDWGYVTIVITEGERNTSQWNAVFNQMRRKHIIPLIRIATRIVKDMWTVPDENEADKWVAFFESLNWPVENRYIILYNEPNHAKEWGGNIDPAGYAKTVVDFAHALTTANDAYFILPAGLDASANSSRQTMDVRDFLRQAVIAEPQFLSVLDGWTSHSYPNPGFSASPSGWGQGSIRSFEWELNVLKEFNVNKNLPVFITETGWSHNISVSSPGRLSTDLVARYIQTAAQGVWLDTRIVAVTPFVFSYLSYPFDQFSWKKLGSDEFYPQYYTYKSLSKITGYPKQFHQFTLNSAIMPENLVVDSTYTFTGSLKNTGQSILDAKDGWKLKLQCDCDPPAVLTDDVPYLEPGETGTLSFHMKTASKTGTFSAELALTHGPDSVSLEKRDILFIPPPSLQIHAQLGWKKTSNTDDATILIYSSTQTLLHKFTGLSLKNGSVEVPGLTNIVPEQQYRVVLLVPYYLPRQSIVALSKERTAISMKRLIPLDSTKDGAFTIHDIMNAFLIKPSVLVSRFFGP